MITTILISVVNFYLGCGFIVFLEDNEGMTHRGIPLILKILICLFWPYKYLKNE